VSTIAELRGGLKANLATIAGLRTTATVPDQPQPPMAVVLPPSIQYDRVMARGMDEYSFRVLVIVGRVDERSAQGNLDAYCAPTGSGSIKTALESDRTLGGKAFDLHVTEMRGTAPLVIGDGVTYLTAEWVVQVLA